MRDVGVVGHMRKDVHVALSYESSFTFIVDPQNANLTLVTTALKRRAFY